MMALLARRFTPKVRPFPLDAFSQIVVDGNSISADHGGVATLADLLGQRLPVDTSSCALSGQTWADMLAAHADVDAAWSDEHAAHALVVNETTNSIRTGRSVTDTKADITAYLAAVTSAHPWVIVGWSALPAGHADEVTYPGEHAENLAIIELNEWMRDNADSLGIDCWINARSIPQYAHDGSDPSYFEAYQSGWQETPGSAQWDQFGWLHPTLGTDTTGKTAIAKLIADTFTAGHVPADPRVLT